MKTINAFMRDFLIGVIIILTASLSGCKKEEVYFADGVFPDSTIILSKISTSNNDIAEDFSVDENDLDGTAELLITTNSTTSGGNTDISQAIINFSFGHKTGTFTIDCSASTDPFIARLLTKSNTSRNDLGPYRLFSSIDGFEYMIYSTAGNAGDLDFYFLRNQPSFGTILTEVQGPSPVTLLNTSADEDYICFDLNMDTCYFTSGPDGNQDIYVKSKSLVTDFASWLSGNYSVSARPDSINSEADDKSPRIYRNFMVFSSNRPGGLGGYDLYYSVFRKGKWSLPLNMGPEINTAADEIKPLIGKHSDYTNNFIIFSSNREGGKGGFDIYFKGVKIYF